MVHASFVKDRATGASLFEIRPTTSLHRSIKTRVPPFTQPIDNSKGLSSSDAHWLDNFAAYLHQQSHASRLAVTVLYSFAASGLVANHLIEMNLGVVQGQLQVLEQLHCFEVKLCHFPGAVYHRRWGTVPEAELCNIVRPRLGRSSRCDLSQ